MIAVSDNDLPTCEYFGDEDSAIGVESEYIEDDGYSLRCSADAELVLRGRSGQAFRVSRQRGRLLCCKAHGRYLQGEAQLDWEVVGTSEEYVKRIANMEDRSEKIEGPGPEAYEEHLPDPPEEGGD